MSAAEWVSLVKALLLVRIGVVAAVEARAQFRVAEHFIRLVDARHLLLGILLGETLLGGLVRVVLLGQLAVGGFDLSLISVVWDADDLVVVFCFAAFECNLGITQKLVGKAALGFGWCGFLCLLERVDGSIIIFGVKLGLALMEKTVERVLVEGQGFSAVFLGLFAV